MFQNPKTMTPAPQIVSVLQLRLNLMASGELLSMVLVSCVFSKLSGSFFKENYSYIFPGQGISSVFSTVSFKGISTRRE